MRGPDKACRRALAFTALLLTACHHESLTGPTGKVSLRFDGASGGQVFFILENRTAHPIRFPGKTPLGQVTEPALADISCENGPQNIYNAYGLDGIKWMQPGLIAVGPESHKRLALDLSDSSKGLKCMLTINLERDQKLTSDAFTF